MTSLPRLRLSSVIRATVVTTVALFTGIAGSGILPQPSAALTLTPDQAYRLEAGRMTAGEYLQLRSLQSTPAYISPTSANCTTLATQCSQQSSLYSYPSSTNVCVSYRQYCGTQIAPTVAYDPSVCRTWGSCAYGNTCPSATSCSGYPSYSCVADTCVQSRSLYTQPIYSRPTSYLSMTEPWWQPIRIPLAPALPTITPAPALPTITPAPSLPTISPAPALPTITPAPDIPTYPEPTYPATSNPVLGTCACYQIYDPVCAQNGVTYPNDCEARCAGQDVAVRGTCDATQPNPNISFLRSL